MEDFQECPSVGISAVRRKTIDVWFSLSTRPWQQSQTTRGVSTRPWQQSQTTRGVSTRPWQQSQTTRGVACDTTMPKNYSSSRLRT
jgi:hypothetical protein